MANKHYTPLPQSKLKAGTGYELAGTNSVLHITLDSPAIDVMTDLRRVEALTTSEADSIDVANKIMLDYGVRSLIVVDDSHRVAGILTSLDVLGDKPMQLINERNVLHSDILVRDVMTPAGKIDAIEIKDVLTATVGRVVETLKHSGRKHALVVDHVDGTHHRVCGIFSATQIERQMNN